MRRAILRVAERLHAAAAGTAGIGASPCDATTTSNKAMSASGAATTATALSAADGQPLPAATTGAAAPEQQRAIKVTLTQGQQPCALHIVRAAQVSDLAEANSRIFTTLRGHVSAEHNVLMLQMQVCSDSLMASYLATLAGFAATQVDVYTIVTIWRSSVEQQQQQQAFMQSCAAEAAAGGHTREWCNTNLLQLTRPTLVFRLEVGVQAMTDIGLEDAVMMAVPCMPMPEQDALGSCKSEALAAVYAMAAAGV